MLGAVLRDGRHQLRTRPRTAHRHPDRPARLRDCVPLRPARALHAREHLRQRRRSFDRETRANGAPRVERQQLGPVLDQRVRRNPREGLEQRVDRSLLLVRRVQCRRPFRAVGQGG